MSSFQIVSLLENIFDVSKVFYNLFVLRPLLAKFGREDPDRLFVCLFVSFPISLWVEGGMGIEFSQPLLIQLCSNLNSFPNSICLFQVHPANQLP